MTEKTQPRCTHISPILPVRDLDRALAFYTGVLGFDVGFRDEGYAYIVRDEVAIRLLVVPEGHQTEDQSFYICVVDLDGLYQQLKPALDKLESGRVRTPFNQTYGQREFHVLDEDSILIFFGEAIGA